MIFYLVTRAHAYTLDVYLDTWGRRLRRQLRALPYEQLVHYRTLQPGTYIFSDLERLNEPQLELATRAWDLLATAGDAVRLLNSPSKALRRESLLRELHRTGHNPFAVYRVDEDLSKVRFPAFVRRTNEHDGNLSPLVHSLDELTQAIARTTASGVPRDDLLIVEYCRTADADGMYRKYSAFRVGGRIIPRHLLIGREWVLKHPEIVDDRAVREEEAYLHDNPHERQLAPIFELANVDYGRIDYSLLDGQIVTWEINTNPTITVEPAKLAPPRLPGQARFARQFHEILEALDRPASGPPLSFNLPPDLKQRLGVRRRDRILRHCGSVLRRLSTRTPWRQMLDAAR